MKGAALLFMNLVVTIGVAIFVLMCVPHMVELVKNFIFPTN